MVASLQPLLLLIFLLLLSLVHCRTYNPLSQVLDGIGYSFGLFMEPLQQHFGCVGKGTIAMVSLDLEIRHLILIL